LFVSEVLELVLELEAALEFCCSDSPISHRFNLDDQ
jgi:hypothetical protein